MALDKVMNSIKPKGALKPKKALWIQRRPELLRLKDQAKDITGSLAASLDVLLNIQNAINLELLHSRIDPLFHILSQSPGNLSVTETRGTYLAIDSADVTISNTSLHTRDYEAEEKETLTVVEEKETLTIVDDYQDEGNDSLSNVVATTNKVEEEENLVIAGDYQDEGTDSFSDFVATTNQICQMHCQCKCHLIAQISTPTWIRHILGLFTIYGNGTILFGKKTCDKDYCHASGPLYVQMSYTTPAWTLAKTLIMCMQSSSVTDPIPLYNICFPRVIPYTAQVWSFVELGKVSALRTMFTDGLASPYDIGLDGTSLLKYALVHGQYETYKLLLDLKAHPYFRDQFGVMAVQPGIDRALCGLDLRRDNNPSKQTIHDFNVTDEAWDQQSFTNLHLAIFGRMPGTLSYILQKHKPDMDSPDANGRTPLLWAAWRGDTESVTLLLDNGADINKTDRESFTPLARAVQTGHLATVRILLQRKALVTTKTSKGHQPIHLASENKIHGHEVVRELFAYGADPNAYSPGSGTPLHNAANHGSIETIKLLLENGTDIDTIGENGDSAAMVALYCWNEEQFVYLAESGARLDVVNDSDHNIVQIAVWGASTKVWDLIIRRAEEGTLGYIDVHARHDGHDIEECYLQCRRLWYLGQREDPQLERARFDRMIDACGFQRLDLYTDRISELS